MALLRVTSTASTSPVGSNGSLRITSESRRQRHDSVASLRRILPRTTVCSATGNGSSSSTEGSTRSARSGARNTSNSTTSSSNSGTRESGSSSLPSPFAFVGLDFYQMLGVPVGSTPAEIRRAYRALQKKYHPDIAGEEAHGISLQLNEAYDTLMDDTRRARYEREWKEAAVAGYVGFTGQARSKWAAPEGQTQAIFVDEQSCVGCRECVFAASSTFAFDADAGVARVKTQWGDALGNVQAAIDSCPVSCIHTVHREDLAALEFLMQPRKKESTGVYGGGWGRSGPANIFVAAQEFKRKLKSQEDESARRKAAESSLSQETPAQRAAREAAAAKVGGAFWQKWTAGFGAAAGFSRSTAGGQGDSSSGSKEDRSQQKKGGNDESSSSNSSSSGFPWQRMLGTSTSSELLRHKAVHHEGDAELITFLQEWATLWSFSSELPLPLPIRADNLTKGVELTLIAMERDLISAVGSLIVTVEPFDPEIDASSPWDLTGLWAAEKGGGTSDSSRNEWVVSVRRKAAQDNRALPGEGTIVKALRDALSRHDSMRGYESYHLPRPTSKKAK